MSLTITKLQNDLREWCIQWKKEYAEDLHRKAYKNLEQLSERTKYLN